MTKNNIIFYEYADNTTTGVDGVLVKSGSGSSGTPSQINFKFVGGKHLRYVTRNCRTAVFWQVSN